jgi:acetyl-CoA synthetase
MSEVYSPSPKWGEKSWIKDLDEYQKMYQASVDDPEAFWSEVAEQFHWEKKWDKVLEWDFGDKLSIEWFKGGKTNVCYNCLDRHLDTIGDRIAFYWEGNSPDEQRTITYKELHAEVSKFANILKARGVKKGDRVSIYMPMVLELTVAVLACARIGAMHSVVFGGFSAEALADRILDSECKIVITTNGVYRGAKAITLKANADAAMDKAKEGGCEVTTCVVVNRVEDLKVDMQDGRDIWYHEAMAKASADCPVEWMDAEDPLFILYTSGSTGKPKGVLHTTGGYMIYTTHTFKHIFDYHEDDVYWCTADIGWVTGHSYIVYGPLCAGATSVMFEGVPTYPDAGRFWDVVDKYKVSIFYTAPTAIRAVAAQGNDFVTSRDRSSLRLLGTVGEPINPEAWKWYYEVVGEKRCPIVDTWWQTETGGIMITPLPASHPLKPGSATLPYFGVQPMLVDDKGEELKGAASGILTIKHPWPGMMRTLYGDHKRFKEVYFSAFENLYFTGDGCRRDEDGYYWITGRVDDVINVSGHRMGTAEVESALVSHSMVAEAAVVGFPHAIKGEGIYAYVTLNVGNDYTDELKAELVKHVRKEIGPIAAPDNIHWAPGLPKTRSGKIMRRILRKIASNDLDQLGDTSTLADPSVVDALVKNKG